MVEQSLWNKFLVHAKANGPAVFNAAETPLLESTERDYPWLRMALRAKKGVAQSNSAAGYQSKIKWKHSGNYGALDPGTAADWQRHGSFEFLESEEKREWGSLQFIESEVKRQISGAFDPGLMAQKFDDVLNNMKQDMYVNLAEVIDGTLKAVPSPQMETDANVMRSLFMGMNEWKQGHGVRADGCFPGITKIQNYDPLTPGAKMAAHVENYSNVGKQDGLTTGHIYEAFMRGTRAVDFRSVPLAESFTQGTQGHNECFASIEGIAMVDRTHAAHDNVIAEEGVGPVYTLTPRVLGVQLMDTNDLENLAICPSYDANGDPSTAAAALYQEGAAEQTYFTELTAPNARGPRFYLPYQKDLHLFWGKYMHTSPIYPLKESVTDAYVMWIENFRNLHWESFRRNLVIAPNADIPGFAA